jgi:hypothetical protein
MTTLRLAGLMVAVGALGAVTIGALARHIHPLPDPRYPIDVSAGLNLPLPVIRDSNAAVGLFVLTIGVVALICWLGWRLSQHDPGKNRQRWLIAAQALALIALCFIPWSVSGDVYYYVVIGHVYGIEHLNPYFPSHPIQTSDLVLRRLLDFWGNPWPANVYGPLWTLLTGATARAEAAWPLWLQYVTHRVFAVTAALFVTGGLLHMLRGAHDAQAYRRAGYFAFHPLVALECAINGHNDMIMVAFAVWALALAEELPVVAGLLAGAAIATKYAALVVAPFVFIVAARRGVVPAAACIAATFVTIVICFVPFWAGPSVLSGVVHQGARVEGSLASLLEVMTGHQVSLAFEHALVATLFTAFLTVAMLSYYRFFRNGKFGEIVLACVALVWSLPALHPQYVAWLSPAAAAASRWGRYVWWFGACALLEYVLFLMRPPQSHALTLTIYAVTVAIILFAPIFLAARGAESKPKP